MAQRMGGLAIALFVAPGCGTSDARGDAGSTGALTIADAGATDGSSGMPPGTSSSTPGTTSTSGESTAADGTTASAKFDLSPIPDTMPMECIMCGLTIASMQSGVFSVEGANVFATATLMDQVVYALGTQGAGRFIATADSSLPFNEVSDCPLVEWLGGAAEPRLLWFGWTDSDGPINFDYPGDRFGVHLPDAYIGNPAALAADYEIVMYLEASGQFDGGDEPSDAEMQTLVDYVSTYGGGLYISSEFADPGGSAYLTLADLASINRALVPLGLTAQQVSLAWGNVDGNIDFECFPPPAG